MNNEDSFTCRFVVKYWITRRIDMHEKDAMIARSGQASLANSIRPMSTRDQLENQLKYHEEKIRLIHEAIALLQRNPDMEKFTDLMKEI